MRGAVFEFDPRFDYNLLHWKGSLNGVGGVFRRVADKRAGKVRTAARKRLAEAVAARNTSLPGRYRKSGRLKHSEARAMVYSLKRYVELVAPVLVEGGEFNYSAVVAGHAAADRVEYGGVDRVIELSDGSKLVYPPMHILRAVV